MAGITIERPEEKPKIEIPPMEEKAMAAVTTLTSQQQTDVINIGKKVKNLANHLKDLFAAARKPPEKIELEMAEKPELFTYVIPETGAKITLTRVDIEGKISLGEFAKIPEVELNKIALAVPSKDEAEFKELFLAGLSKWKPEEERAEVIMLSPETITNIKKATDAVGDLALEFGRAKPKEKPVAGGILASELPEKQKEVTSTREDTEKLGKEFAALGLPGEFSLEFVPADPDTVEKMAMGSVSKINGAFDMAVDSLKTVEGTMLAMAEKEKEKKKV